MAVSRHYLYSDFSEPWTVENKIMIFADRMRGWLFYPAEEVIQINPHAGFVVLLSLVNYFEMIGKYIDGCTDDFKSNKYFIEGFKDVAPYIGIGASKLIDSQIISIYKNVRNALYHTGITGRGVVLTGDAEYAIEIKESTIIINPRKLVVSLSNHFDSYVNKLNDPNETKVRDKFEKRFNYLHR